MSQTSWHLNAFSSPQKVIWFPLAGGNHRAVVTKKNMGQTGIVVIHAEFKVQTVYKANPKKKRSMQPQIVEYEMKKKTAVIGIVR